VLGKDSWSEAFDDSGIELRILNCSRELTSCIWQIPAGILVEWCIGIGGVVSDLGDKLADVEESLIRPRRNDATLAGECEKANSTKDSMGLVPSPRIACDAEHRINSRDRFVSCSAKVEGRCRPGRLVLNRNRLEDGTPSIDQISLMPESL